MRAWLRRMAALQRTRGVKNPLSWYSPRFWHGMRLGTWLKQLVRNRFALSPRKIPMAFAVTAASTANSGLAAIDRLVYARRVAQVELAQSPLFILGHWRSGTTFLHELLIRDANHTYPSTYQCFAPHHFVLSQSWLAPLTEMLLPHRRPMDNMEMGWQRPQEDEFALCNMGVPTPYLSTMFPNHGAVCTEYADLQDLSPADLGRWRHELLTFFQRIAYRDNRRIVVKSPLHTARVRTLLEMFPKAKFVHLVRDPYDVFASTVRLWKSLNEVQGFQVPGDQSWLDEYVLDTLVRMYEAFEQDRRLLSDEQLFELRYEDLVANPQLQLEQLYGQLKLGDFSQVEAATQRYLAEVKNYRTNRHQLEEATQQQIRQRWSIYFQKYGYLASPETAEV